jgi:hypothetical protein
VLVRAERLKVVSRHGVGYDNIDVGAASARDRREPGANGPLRLILMRFGPAEIGENASRHEIRHVPVEMST